jgi:flagellar hook-length control protein FliK
MEVPGLPQVALQPSRVPGDEAGEDPSAIAAEATADTSGQEAVQLPKFPQPQPVDGRVTAPPPDRSDARLAASEPSRLASEVRSIAFRGLTEAQLQLEPAELGSVAVHIALDGGRVSVVMTVDTPHGLEALQAQAPVLRESFQQLGMQLDRLDLAPSGSTAWSDGRTGQEGRHPAEQTRPTWRFPGWGAEERLDGKSSLVPGAHAGMVDYRI